MRAPYLPVCSVLLVTVLFAAILLNPALAQEAPEPPRPALFGQLFAQSTGTNGYEDWVQAGDEIRNNPQIEQTTAPPAISRICWKPSASSPLTSA